MINIVLLKQPNKRRYIKGITTALFVILFALFCLDGAEYARCISIYPDEIMDLHFSMPCLLAEIERSIETKGIDNLQDISIRIVYKSLIYSLCKKNFHLLRDQISQKNLYKTFLHFMRYRS